MTGPAAARVLAYHERTKHFPTRFARSLGYLDWASQPDPFRRFAGAPRALLPLDEGEAGPMAWQIYEPGSAPPAPLTAASVGRFLELSLGVTAWKSYQSSRWALRANPSSGNLHPTEGYCWLPALEGIAPEPALHHYRADAHALEQRCALAPDRWDSIAAGLPPGAFLAGLSSVHWREAWKYGERAYRYCQHDVGHAVGALRYAAAVLGWDLRVLEEPSDEDVAALLGLDRSHEYEGAEAEAPDLLAAVVPAGSPAVAAPALDGAVAAARGGRWSGRANRLSAERVEWDAIDAVEEAARKPRGARAPAPKPNFPPPVLEGVDPALPAVRVLRRRRSAVAFDGETPLSRERFFLLLDRTLPRDAAPFDAFAGSPAIHLAIFVHRVTGLDRGLYLLLRDPAARAALAAALRPGFSWKLVEGAPPHLSLFLLERRDMTGHGRAVACDQEIAGEGAFSLGMLADLEGEVSRGAWRYRRVHHEAGLLGQVLYLEAEAAGFRGTGIGCFFDDEMHGLLGCRGGRYLTIYHFAVGNPVDDPRLQTWPAYMEAARALAP